MIVTSIWDQVVEPFAEECVTPQGYDFRAAVVKRIIGDGKVFVDGKDLPRYENVPVGRLYTAGRTYAEGWLLKEGAYMVQFLEKVKIPTNCMGTMHPRSTLLRSGVSLQTAIWDAGYEGISSTLLVVHNSMGFQLERYARVGHMTLHTLDREVEGYTGSYQNEGLVRNVVLA